MEVRLLGPLEVVGDTGRTAAVPGAKLRTLLTVLALDAGSVVSADRLIETLYGDDLPARPANALHLLVSKLRRALVDVEDGGAEVLVTRAPGYLLALDRDQIDALRFERMASEGRRLLDARPEEAGARLRDALSLWRGEALVDLAYHDVATVERSRLEELRLEAVENRIDAELAAGAHADVLAELERLTATHPMRERLWGQLMVALYRHGRQADALRAYQQARAELLELGLEPGPPLRRLEAAILAQDPALEGPVRSNRRAGNLPLPLTELVGRKQEVANVRVLLGVHRLVTIVGPGGAGKTRLAIEVGRSFADQVADGVWIVELAPVEGPAVVATTAAVLGASQSGQHTAAGLVRALSGRDLLLVLDNCEHVIDDAAQLVHALVSQVPTVRVLATSREALGIPGEHCLLLPPLDIDAAVELFAERVESAGGPSVVADEEGRREALEICSRLDGLPLAVELAASRAVHLSAAEVVRRLDDRFRLLSGGPRTADPRQHTLRAVVDWSWDLLDDQERRVFRRFSAFAGSASLDAAEQVCADDEVRPDEVAAVLARLEGKSLVFLDQSGRRPRFGMLQTLVHYARDRLTESGEEEMVRRRHAHWAADLVARAEAGLRSGTQLVWLARLAVELDNVRAAVSWATANDRQLALATSGNLGWFCYMTDQAETGWTLLSAALDGTSGVSPARARALAFAAALGKMSGHLEQAAVFAEEAEAAIPAHGAQALLGSVLGVLALADVQSGAAQSVRALLTRARPCFDHPAQRWWLGYLDLGEAIAALYDGEAAEAFDLLDRSVANLRAVADAWMCLMALIPRAYLAERGGRLDEAAAALEEGLAGAAQFQEALVGTPVRLALVTIGQARLALIRGAQGRFEEAVRLAQRAVDEAGVGSPTVVAIADQARGRAMIGLGRRDEGRADLERAARLFRTLGVGVAVAECLVDVGLSWLADGNAAAAVASLERARADALGTEDRYTINSVLIALADANAAAGSSARAWALRSEAGVNPD
ncbi:MAG TPA: BTAD domain-containing putative transcriptional regulator [Acidimicrobiales bacterium]|nr:BTAD domain-containing putative transcriptional regulator [Acidimicrobiales bacterium]